MFGPYWPALCFISAPTIQANKTKPPSSFFAPYIGCCTYSMSGLHFKT